MIIFYIINQMEHNGGFTLFKKKSMTYYDYFKNAQKSEKKLITEYKKYLKLKETYEKIFNIHLENLSKLDKQFNNCNSFKKCFLDMFDDKVDNDTLRYSKPLLLQNYDMIDNFYSKEDIIYFHLIRQILYILYVNFPPEHRLLIKNIDLNNVNKSNNQDGIELIIKTIDGTKTIFPLEHLKYYIDKKKTIQQIDDCLSQMKEYTKKPNETKKTKTKKIKTKNTIDDILIEHKSIKMVDKNLPIIPPLPKNKTLPKNKSIKSISKKKDKDIKDINLPLDAPILPVFEIEIPNKKF